MRSEAARIELDRIDKLKAGEGMLEAWAFGRGDLLNGQVGAGLEYGHRITENASAFLRGTAGYQYGTDRGLVYDASTGLRWRFR